MIEVWIRWGKVKLELIRIRIYFEISVDGICCLSICFGLINIENIEE